MRNELVAFILTYGRPDRVITYNTLKKTGYSGEIYLVCSGDDKTLEEYKKRFGKEKILVFNKDDVAKRMGFDLMDNFDNKKVIIFARNVCWEFARKLGYRYFVQLDDDYTNFSFRFDRKLSFRSKSIKNIDEVFSVMLDFLKNTPAKTIAMAQGGDFMGGALSVGNKIRLMRKAMNSFICDVEKPFLFVGRINEDVNTYALLGSRGEIFFTYNFVSLTQKPTQKNNGGMSDTYLEKGTYIKSFYTVMAMPSAVKISVMGNKFYRIHHSISWNNAVPKIIREEYRKE